MVEQTIQSADMTLRRVFQDFYRVPDYQREYVWGETDQKDQDGDEVERFLQDIHQEFESATQESAPEYFIGTIVVRAAPDQIFELIDGQQRATTSFLFLCAIRDLLKEMKYDVPGDLLAQIAATNTDWQGKTTYRQRMDLQYEDSGGVLRDYGDGNWETARQSGTRSISNLAKAYLTIKEFLVSKFNGDHAALLRFYGYFTNKVKLIRIQTPDVAKALKIFETINDRGVGLDAMDLLKNLLFMHCKPTEFVILKGLWKEITDEIYKVRERPLRFLRYFVMASYDVGTSKLQEDDVYDWFLRNHVKTGHQRESLKFAKQLLEGAKAYAAFVAGQNLTGQRESGIVNTRYLGGSAVRQHYILLLAGRHLKPSLFSRLATEIENLMFVYLITNTTAKEYERSIVDAAASLRKVRDEAGFDRFCDTYFSKEKSQLSKQFDDSLLNLHKGDTRGFRIRYLLAKLTQYIDINAYGEAGAHGDLGTYFDGKNDIEHVLPEAPSAAALSEFEEQNIDAEIIQRLGNLAYVEESINRLLGNKPYSEKIAIYPQSKYLLTKCQAVRPSFGKADKITKAISNIPSFPKWNRQALESRQEYLAGLAREVWGMA